MIICLSEPQLVSLYGPNWQSAVIVNGGPFSTLEECNGNCSGVCCSGICSSCSFSTGNSSIIICNGVVGDDPWWGIDEATYNPNSPPVWIPGRWRYQVTYSIISNSPSSTGWQWKPGYPGILGKHIWMIEYHSYREIQSTAHLGIPWNSEDKGSLKTKWRLYSCQNGGAVEIPLDDAVEQIDYLYACYRQVEEIEEPIGPVTNCGKTLDWSYSTDELKLWDENGNRVDYQTERCLRGYATAGWSGNQQPIAFSPPNNFLSCTQRECTDISKTDCESAGGTWHPGLNCSQVNCN